MQADLHLREVALRGTIDGEYYAQLADALSEVLSALRWPTDTDAQVRLLTHVWQRVYPALEGCELPLTQIWRLWLPLAVDIERRRIAGRPFFQGVLGPQGTGKTTAVAVLKRLLEQFGLRVVALSLDDFYLSALERRRLQIARRGPPGTHGLTLALATFEALRTGHVPLWVPRFDKGAQAGLGDRFAWVELQPDLVLDGTVSSGNFVLTGCRFKERPIALPQAMGSAPPLERLGVSTYPDGTPLTVVCDPHGKTLQTPEGACPLPEVLLAGWSLSFEPPEVVLFEGWFVGMRPVEPALLSTGAAQASNRQLAAYAPLWDYLDRLMLLRPVDPALSKTWRRQAEAAQREAGLGGMDDEAIDRFVEFFWEALPPAVFYPPVLKGCHLVVEVGADQQPEAIFRPE